MTEWGVFLIVTAMIGFMGTSYSMFFKPIERLNVSIEILIQRLTNMEERDALRDVEIGTNKADIKCNSKTLVEHDKRITLTEKEIFDLKNIKNTHFIKDRSNE